MAGIYRLLEQFKRHFRKMVSFPGFANLWDLVRGLLSVGPIKGVGKIIFIEVFKLGTR